MTTATPQSNTYKGFTFALTAPGMVCPWFVYGVKRYARDEAHAHELIDAHVERVAQPRQPGELRVVAADVRGEYGLSASACRNRIEQARGQRRVGGKFASEVGA